MSRKETQTATAQSRKTLSTMKAVLAKAGDSLDKNSVAALCSHYSVEPYGFKGSTEGYDKAKRAADRFQITIGHTLFICKGTLFIYPSPF